MRHLLKKAFFGIYVAGVRIHAFFGQQNETMATQTFIGKDSWFLLWHFFFWRNARRVLASFMAVPPLACDRSADMTAHYQRFSELAARDSSARPKEAQILKPTRYPLAPDTVKELCLLYGCIAAMAPWEYGLSARLSARTKMSYVLVLSVAVFVGAIFSSPPGSEFFANLIFGSFCLSMLSLLGWCADSALCRIAAAAERLMENEEISKT